MIDASSLKPTAREIAKMGRNGDTMLAHINPQEAALLKSLGGSGTINPHTGLPEFWGLSDLNPVKIVRNTFNAVGDALSGVADAVGDAFQAIGDVVSSVGETFVKTIDAIIRDPLPMIATAALIYIGVPPAIANAAVAAANGADPGKIALAVATSYAGAQIGQYAGQAYAGVPISQLTNPTEIAMAKIITSSSTMAATAALQGKPLDQVLAAGVTGGMTSLVANQIQAAGFDPKSLPATVFSKMVSSATAAVLNNRDVDSAIANATVGTLVDYGFDQAANAVKSFVSSAPTEKIDNIKTALSSSEGQLAELTASANEQKANLDEVQDRYNEIAQKYSDSYEKAKNLQDYINGFKVSDDQTHYVDANGVKVEDPDVYINQFYQLSDALGNMQTYLQDAQNEFLALNEEFTNTNNQISLVSSLVSSFESTLQGTVSDAVGGDIESKLSEYGIDPEEISDYTVAITNALSDKVLSGDLSLDDKDSLFDSILEYSVFNGTENLSSKIDEMSDILEIAHANNYDETIIQDLLAASSAGATIDGDFITFLNDNLFAAVEDPSSVSAEDIKSLSDRFDEYMSSPGNTAALDDVYSDLYDIIKTSSIEEPEAPPGYYYDFDGSLKPIKQITVEGLPETTNDDLGTLIDQQQAEDQFYVAPEYDDTEDLTDLFKPEVPAGLDFLSPYLADPNNNIVDNGDGTYTITDQDGNSFIVDNSGEVITQEPDLGGLIGDQQDQDPFYEPPTYDDTTDLTDTFTGGGNLDQLVQDQQTQDPFYEPPTYDDTTDLTDTFIDTDKNLIDLVQEQQEQDPFYEPPTYDDTEDLTDLFKEEDKDLIDLVREQQAEDPFYEEPEYSEEDLNHLFQDDTTTGGGGGGISIPIGGGSTTGGGTTGGGAGTTTTPTTPTKPTTPTETSSGQMQGLFEVGGDDISAYNPLAGATWAPAINVPIPTFFSGTAQPTFFDPLMDNEQPQVEEESNYAQGGLVDHNPEFFSEGGASLANRYVKGDGDGTSDSVPAMLASGEFVIPADVVSSLGNGDNDAGAGVLDQFLKVIRTHKRNAHEDELPPDSKGPLSYLAEAQKRANHGRT